MTRNEEIWCRNFAANLPRFLSLFSIVHRVFGIFYRDFLLILLMANTFRRGLTSVARTWTRPSIATRCTNWCWTTRWYTRPTDRPNCTSSSSTFSPFYCRAAWTSTTPTIGQYIVEGRSLCSYLSACLSDCEENVQNYTLVVRWIDLGDFSKSKGSSGVAGGGAIKATSPNFGCECKFVQLNKHFQGFFKLWSVICRNYYYYYYY